MYRRSFVLRSKQDVQQALAELPAELERAAIPPASRQFLRDQLATTLGQFERQLSTGHVRHLAADRILEGDGYKVTIRLRCGAERLVDKLKRLLTGR